MSKKRLLVFVLLLAVAVLSNYLIATKIQPDAAKPVRLILKVSQQREQNYQVYYNAVPEWTEKQSVLSPYNKVGKQAEVSFSIANDTGYIRLDMGILPDIEHTIYGLEIKCANSTIELPLSLITDSIDQQQVASVKQQGDTVLLTTAGDDPYVVLDVSAYDFREFALAAQEKPVLFANVIRCLAVDLLILGAFLFANRLFAIPKDLYHNRHLILSLAKNDFKTRYAGSYLGIFWAFVQPVVTIAVYSFVFQVGFRSGAVMDCPFVLWLISGMVPWFFFSDALNGGSACLLEYSYLVKKVVFKISILPVVKVISALFVHLIFMGITILLFALFGYFPDLYTLQIIYYTFAMFVFVLAVCYLTCSLMVFFRDLGQIIGIILQVGVWMTPIMWQETMIGENIRWVLKLNPIYYVVSGYRDALINKQWFWQNVNQTIYFWFVTAVIFALGSLVFKRLRVHFADVL